MRWQTFTYDSENRLVKTETMANSQVETTSSYQYDSLGRRVGKQSNIKGQTDQKHFLWQGLRMLREESPEQSSLYLYEPCSYAPLARVDQREGEDKNKIYYYHTDQIGTPLEMTDAEGHIVWQAKYAPWGLIKQLVVNEVEQNLRFQGQYFDVETGLHYNTFRYYDPEIGRFITQDPIGLSGGDNLYLYAPNPYGWVDPLGWCKGSENGSLEIAPGKFDYLFGRAASNAHNAARSNQLALEMKRLGVSDSSAGRQMLTEHLALSTKNQGNVISTFSNQYGKFEVRESLFIGPSGRTANSQSTFQVLDDGTRKLIHYYCLDFCQLDMDSPPWSKPIENQ
ncbi:Rhs family protein [Pseudomonas syringae pv. viburni]|uniref:Rhs family protein n=1 Tax=Pseudomonas syringae pv. viburni TaxID=251703 RepID=A0A0N8TF04_9PSED|nr:Rhs family protein [Pseudomonas syringae pv. viburni]